MNAVFAALGRTVVKFRWVVVAVWLLGSVAIIHSFPSLASQINNDNTAFLAPSAPSQAAAKLATPLIGSQKDTEIPVVVANTSRPLGTADAVAVAALQLQLAKVDGVVGTPQRFAQSKDGHAIELLVTTNVSSFNRTGITTLVNDLVATNQKASFPQGTSAHVAGAVASSVASDSQSQKQNNSVQLFSVLFIIVLLLLIYRSILAPFLTLFPALLTVGVSGAVIGELGSHGLKISAIAEILLTVLILGAGTDYGLFLVFRVREEIERGRSHHDAVAEAVLRVGESITASAGTVIVALLTLLFATFGLYKDLGVPLAVGIAVMLLAGLTLLPALLAIFGRAVFWPAKITPREQKDRLWGRVAGGLIKRPAVTLVVGVVCFGLLAIFAFGYKPAGFGGTTTAPAGSDAAIGGKLLATYFPQASSNPTNVIFELPEGQSVWSNPEVLTTTEDALRSKGLFTTIASALNASGTTLTPAQLTELHAACAAVPAHLGNVAHGALDPTCLKAAGSQAVYFAYRTTSRFISSDGRVFQFEVGLVAGDPSSTAATNAVPQIRTAVTDAAHAIGASDSGVAGAGPALYDISKTSNDDLHTIVPIAVLAIGLILALVLRSLIAPLYLIASVLLSYAASLGFSVLVFMKIGSDGGLVFFLPFLMFIFLLALGEDYNILVMTRIREEAVKHPLKEAVVRAVGSTGTTVTSAGLVLAGTFLVLAFAGGSGGGGNSQLTVIGVGVASGILLDTFVVRTVLVPATVVLLGRWNWWPSSIHRDEAAPAEVETGA